MTFKVGGCAGHGGYKSLNPKVYATAGKRTPDGEPEWIFNDKMLRAFEDELNKYEGVEFRRFDDPSGKTDVPLKIRTDNANAWKANIYISFHHNASTGKWGNWTGTETFIQEGVGGESLELAKLVHPALVRAYGLKDRGIKTANFHITRETKMPSILIEGAYMDSKTDIVKMRDDKVLENAGRFIAQAVAHYANLKLKPISIVTDVKGIQVSPPLWDGTEMKKGQIGRVTILKSINLWKDSTEGKLEMMRVLQPNETYRVYGYRDEYGGQFNVGGAWVTNMDGYVKYETPSANKLKEAEEFYGN